MGVNIRFITFGSDRVSRGQKIALAAAAIAIGGVFLALGIALLATLAVAGAVIAGGMAIARVLRGGKPTAMREPPLDPSMEVFPRDSSEARRLEGQSKAR